MKAFWITFPCILFAGLSYAQSANLDQTKSPLPHTKSETKYSNEGSKISQGVYPSPSSTPSNISITAGGKQELATDVKEINTPEKQQVRFSEFFNVKATDIVIAAFTGVLAVFTYFLYKATANLAHIASRQEQFTRTLERPYIVPAYTTDGILPSGMATNVYPSVPATYNPGLHYGTINCGKTPAIITENYVDLVIIDTLPTTPPYVHETFGRAILGAGDKQGPAHVQMGDGSNRRFTIEDWQDLRDGKKFFFFFGFVKYESVFGQEHRTGFGYRFHIKNGRSYLAEEGGEAYNYYI